MAEKAAIPPQTVLGSRVPVERLIEYEEALARLRPAKVATLGDLLECFRDISRKLFVDDLRELGQAVGPSIDLSNFASAVRQAKNRALDRGLQPALVFSGTMDVEWLKTLLRESTSVSTQRARAREAAFEVAAQENGSFLLALGDLSDRESAFRHQVESATRIAGELGGCGIIGDEVGLGKTITGCLILREFAARGLVKNSLILVPGNLVKQWQDELEVFFPSFRPFVPRGHDAVTVSLLEKKSHIMLDLDKAKEKPYADIILSRDWDCLVVDEAHRLRNHQTERWKFCYSIRATFMVFLTASPVQNTAYDIFNIITLLRPGRMGDRATYRQMHLQEDGMVVDPELLQAELKEVLIRNKRTETNLSFPKRIVVEVEVPVRARAIQEKNLYNDVLGFLRTVYRRYLKGAVALPLPSESVRHVQSMVLVAMMVLRELGSHPKAALATLGSSFRNRVKALSDAIHDFSDLKTLDHLLSRYSDYEWVSKTHGKTDELLKQLPKIVQDSGKCVVYAEFLDSVDALKKVIQGSKALSGVELILYTGPLPRTKKTNAVARFSDAPGPCVLLSTDCGGEGLNLQAAGAIVNYDFPWNPMKVEQRIGRIDRIGQARKSIKVYNCYTLGTIEMYVYAVLQKKLDVCHDIMGGFASPITRLMLRRPEDLGIGDLILSAEDDEAMARGFERLEKEIDRLEPEEERERAKSYWF